MNIMQLEKASRLAWPALEEQELSFGLLRYAKGAGHRCNALSLFPGSSFDSKSLIDATEVFFIERNASPSVRLLQAANDSEEEGCSLDKLLNSLDYDKHQPTYTMALNLSDYSKSFSSLITDELRLLSKDQWVRAWHEISCKGSKGIDVHREILQKINSPHVCVFRQGVDDSVKSCGMAVQSEDAIGLFGIATESACRNKGYATQLLHGLLSWGVRQGARHAYLQVEAENTNAINLYEKMGFSAMYKYWYRIRKI
jgi:ribosomal protein S18 acetylase RimI-like enzyme